MALGSAEFGERAARTGLPRAHRLGQRIRKALPLYLALLPTFVGLLVFLYYPAFLAVFRAFFKWDIGTPAKWVGLDNFARMFTRIRYSFFRYAI